VGDDVVMDFMLGLPWSNDHFSKYHFASLRASFFFIHVVEVFIAIAVKLHEFLNSIVFYKDKVHISSFWLHIFKL